MATITRGSIVDGVATRLRLSEEQGAHVTLAVLQPLLGSLGRTTEALVEGSLPRALRRHLRHDDPIRGGRFLPPAGFLTELADRNAIDATTARSWTEAVCAALATALPEGATELVSAEVPALVRAFFPNGGGLPPKEESVLRAASPPPLGSAVERPRPSYLAFVRGGPLTGSWKEARR